MHIPSDAMYNASILYSLSKGFHRPPWRTFRHPTRWSTRYRLPFTFPEIVPGLRIRGSWLRIIVRQIVVPKILCNVYEFTRIEFWLVVVDFEFNWELLFVKFSSNFSSFFYFNFLILDVQILKDRIFLLNYLLIP